MASEQSSNANVIYLIRHGEKPKDEDDVKAEAIAEQEMKVKTKDADGNLAPLTIDDLSIDGWSRAQQLPGVLEKRHVIPTYIIAQKPGDGDESKRPEETVSWLKQSILKANYNSSRTTNDFKGVAQDALTYVAKGNVLICWEHNRLINIAQAIGASQPIPYPDDRFDLIWMIEQDNQKKYTQLSVIGSEGTSLDGDFASNEWTRIENGWEELDSKKTAVGKFEYEVTHPVDKTKPESIWVHSEAKPSPLRPKEKWTRENGVDYNVPWTKYKWDKDLKTWQPKKD